MLNVVNGGAHAHNSLDLQEFMIVPGGADDVLGGAALARRGLPHAEEAARGARESRRRSATRAGSRPTFRRARTRSSASSRRSTGPGTGDRVKLALDPATSELFRDGAVPFEGRGRDVVGELLEFYAGSSSAIRSSRSRTASAEDDWEAWKALTDRLGERVQLVGDDLFVTNVERLGAGSRRASRNAILVKVNQIGTLTETLDAIELARANGYGVVISHRSGETEDTTIADLAVATNAGQIKTGAPSRSDRVAKYNQLLRIEEAARRRRGLSRLVRVCPRELVCVTCPPSCLAGRRSSRRSVPHRRRATPSLSSRAPGWTPRG